MAEINIRSYGGNGGACFPKQCAKSLGLQGAGYVDSIIINDTKFGGNGGTPTDILEFESDEYISEVTVHSGNFIDYASFTTNKLRCIKSGGNGGNVSQLKNVRVLALGGRSARLLDQLVIMY